MGLKLSTIIEIIIAFVLIIAMFILYIIRQCNKYESQRMFKECDCSHSIECDTWCIAKQRFKEIHHGDDN